MRLNQFDPLIIKETLPKTRTMQEHDENSDALISLVNDTNSPQSKVWKRRIEIVILVAASVGLLVGVSWLVQANIAHKLAFKIREYSSTVLSIAGYLTLLLSRLADAKRKHLNYILALIGSVLLLFSFGLSFINHKSRLEWWGYFSNVALGTGVITMTFSALVSAERKRLRGILEKVTLVLLLVACVLIFLEDWNTNALALASIVFK